MRGRGGERGEREERGTQTRHESFRFHTASREGGELLKALINDIEDVRVGLVNGDGVELPTDAGGAIIMDTGLVDGDLEEAIPKGVLNHALLLSLPELTVSSDVALGAFFKALESSVGVELEKAGDGLEVLSDGAVVSLKPVVDGLLIGISHVPVSAPLVRVELLVESIVDSLVAVLRNRVDSGVSVDKVLGVTLSLVDINLSREGLGHLVLRRGLDAQVRDLKQGLFRVHGEVGDTLVSEQISRLGIVDLEGDRHVKVEEDVDIDFIVIEVPDRAHGTLSRGRESAVRVANEDSLLWHAPGLRDLRISHEAHAVVSDKVCDLVSVASQHGGSLV